MTAEELKKIKGKSKGAVLKEVLNELRKNESPENIEKLKKALAKEGLDDIFKEKIKTFEWYPIYWYIALIIKAQEILGWTEKDIFQKSYQAPKQSLMAKIFLKYFYDLEKAIQKTGYYWSQMISVGELSVKKKDLKNKTVTLKLKNFKTHPLICICIKGYIKAMAEMISGEKNITVEEEKCIFQGDPNHEFVIKW